MGGVGYLNMLILGGVGYGAGSNPLPGLSLAVAVRGCGLWGEQNRRDHIASDLQF